MTTDVENSRISVWKEGSRLFNLDPLPSIISGTITAAQSDISMSPNWSGYRKFGRVVTVWGSFNDQTPETDSAVIQGLPLPDISSGHNIVFGGVAQSNKQGRLKLKSDGKIYWDAGDYIASAYVSFNFSYISAS